MYKDKNEYDYIIKLVVIGDSGVGKSSLLIRYTQDKFFGDHISTIGVDFKIKTTTVVDKQCKLQLWDSAGQERFAHITKQYFRGARGIIFVFAINSIESWKNIPKWKQMTSDYEIESIIIIGNKCDLESERQVSKADVDRYIKALSDDGIDCVYIETSAATGQAVNDCFENLASRIVMKAEEVKCVSVDNGDKDTIKLGESYDVHQKQLTDEEEIRLESEHKKCC